MNGTLYIVATPIGNLGDMSPRAVEILKSVDLIAAEDTRHSRPLLQHFAINTPMYAYHEHNEIEQTVKLIERLNNGESIAIISDAGTPLINDPGYRLVAAAHEHNITVSPVPGSSAVITALSVAGLPTDRFVYEGYLVAKSGSRKKQLEQLQQESRTIVFYETPHRIKEALDHIAEVFGNDRQMTIARELTKQFEQIVHGDVESIRQLLADGIIKPKGEFVIVIDGIKDITVEEAEVIRIYKILSGKLSSKDAVVLTAEITGMKKNAVYELSLGYE